MFKLVIHLSELDKWSLALNNIRNTVQALSTDHSPFEIALIANAGAVKGYLDPEIRTQISQIQQFDILNIRFLACNNSLTGQNISLNQLNTANDPSIIEIVPVAVIALVEYQNAGFAYIKP